MKLSDLYTAEERESYLGEPHIVIRNEVEGCEVMLNMTEIARLMVFVVFLDLGEQVCTSTTTAEVPTSV